MQFCFALLPCNCFGFGFVRVVFGRGDETFSGSRVWFLWQKSMVGKVVEGWRIDGEKEVITPSPEHVHSHNLCAQFTQPMHAISCSIAIRPKPSLLLRPTSPQVAATQNPPAAAHPKYLSIDAIAGIVAISVQIHPDKLPVAITRISEIVRAVFLVLGPSAAHFPDGGDGISWDWGGVGEGGGEEEGAEEGYRDGGVRVWVEGGWGGGE